MASELAQDLLTRGKGVRGLWKLCGRPGSMSIHRLEALRWLVLRFRRDERLLLFSGLHSSCHSVF